MERVNGRNHIRTDGWTDGQTDERTNGTDENYISLRHTSSAGDIIRVFLSENFYFWR